MDRRKLLKWLGIGGVSISTSGVASADGGNSPGLSINKVAGSPQALAISWDEESGNSDNVYTVYINGQKEIKTQSTHHRLTGLDQGESVVVKIEAYEGEKKEPHTSTKKRFSPGRPEMSGMKTRPATPQDVDKDKWENMSKSEKAEMFENGNHRCKSEGEN
ncbi:hypothetical protein [Halorubrum saccharovorum]|uniref:hypothetical protein n=1 Tax=Halorubrum saccharovorum TaxID=2248 RepID=UPI001267D1CE|nr:hypothetical protein [Halorubrum saccharovorum]